MFARALQAPYCAVKVTGALFHTQGGLDIDAQCRVLREDGTPLPNLLAAGGAARGVSGNAVWGYLSGNGLLSAVAGGFIAARTARQLGGEDIDHDLTATPGRTRALLAPGVYDALTALIAEQAGFEALYLSGASIAYTRLGRSDVGPDHLHRGAKTRWRASPSACACRSSSTPTPASATRSTCSARCAASSAPAQP